MADEVILNDGRGIDKIAEALAKAQAAIVPPRKSHTAKVPTKTGGQYSYTYSTLDELVEALRKPLAANGLSFIQRIVQHERLIGVETNILHASGQILYCGALLLPSGETPQAMGSALSYARRYSLASAFGVAAEDDDDANSGERETKARPQAAAHAPAPRRVAGDEPDDIAYALGPDDEDDPPAPAHRLAPVAGSPTISEKQAKRLFAIAKAHNWTTEALKAHLAGFGYAHSHDIIVAHYDDIIASLEREMTS